MLYKMDAPLVLVVLIGLFASTAYGGDGAYRCSGNIIFEPKFSRGHIIKKTATAAGRSVTIGANMNEDKFRTTSIKVHGTCCWEIEDRWGDYEELYPGESIVPSIAFIAKVKSKECTSENAQWLA